MIGGKELSYLNNKPISISEIKDYPFVAMSSHTQLRQYTDELFKKYNVTITPQIEVDSADVLIPFVKNGLGFSIVPLSLANRSLERDDVIVFDTVEEIPNRGVYLAISKVFPKSEASKIFKKEVVSCALK